MTTDSSTICSLLDTNLVLSSGIMRYGLLGIGMDNGTRQMEQSPGIIFMASVECLDKNIWRFFLFCMAHRRS
jgi:hypothetical protein